MASASALHIYANLLWRENKVEARVKKAAALRLLQESHFRLHLDELLRALLWSPGSAIPHDLLPERLADIVSADCFVYSGDTGNVLLDAASLMAAGKECLQSQIDRVWDTSSPLSWARNQLAWYIVSRQHMDMRPSDLFLAPVDDAESFLAAAWTSRMDLRDHPDHPYTSLHQLLDGETRLELTADQTAVRLHFMRLLLQEHTQQPTQPEAPQTLAATQQLSGGAGDRHARAAEWGQGGVDDGGGEGADVAAATAALRRASLSQQPSGGSGSGARGSHSGANGLAGYGQGHNGGHGSGDPAEASRVDDGYDEAEDYGDDGEEYEDEDEDGRYGSARGGGGAASGGAFASRNADGGAVVRGLPLPLRPDLLPQYVRAVFCATGSLQDALMAVVALALAEAGRPTAHRAWPAAPGPADPALRFSMPLPDLASHVRSRAPHLLAALTGPGGPHGGGGGGGWHAGVLMQRLQERASRGCFRIVVPGTGGAGAGAWGGEGGGGGGGEDAEESVAVLDMDALREEVVRSLATAARTVFSGSRPVDAIRRVAAVQLAYRTRAFAGRAHCVRLSTLARELADKLEPGVFDPNRLGGFERIVGPEGSNNIMHVFRRALPGGVEGLAARANGEEVGTFVTLNLGKLLAAAGVREVEGNVLRGGGRAGEGRMDGRGGAVWVGRGGPEAATVAATSAAAAASAAASHAAAFASSSGRDPHHPAAAAHPPPPPPPPPHHSAAAGVAPGGSSGLPPPPSDGALRQAVEALFPATDGGRGGAGHPAVAAAAAAKRAAALSLVKALHTQQGGFLPLSRLTDLVRTAVPGAPDPERLLAADPELFEFQEAWSGGPRSVRLRTSSVMAWAASATADGSGHSQLPGSSAAGTSSSSPAALPRRPGAPSCAYYMRTGTCGYAASCKYDHPPLGHRQPGHAATEPSPPATAAAAAATGPPRGPAAPAPAAANAPYRQPPPPQQPQPQQPPSLPSPASASAAGENAVAAPAAVAAGARLSPTTLEVKVITTACTPDHLEMLQHCFAAPQVAVACKVRHAHAYYPHAQPAGEAGTVCLVQIYAPAVASAAGAAATGGGAASSSSSGAAAAAAPGGSASGGSGAGGAASSAPRWPATVYLVDPVAGEDRKGLLLPSLSALLEDPAVPKVIFCGSEVVPYMPRISPLHDISVLHTLLARAPHAVLGAAAVEAPSTSLTVPPLATLLQQHTVITDKGAAAMAAAPAHSPMWSSRPLASDLQQQAVLEVVHLASLWTGLMARLGALPQQLSQAAADRLLREHAAHSAAPASAASAASAGFAVVRTAGRAAVAAPLAVMVPAGTALAPVGAGGLQQRGLVSVHRAVW